MDLWHKLTIDWPCAVGDWLWWALVVAPADFLDRLTLKRAILIVGFLLLVYGLSLVFTVDSVIVVFAGDAMMYFDVVSAVILIAAQARVRQAAPVIAATVRRAVVTCARRLARIGARQRRNLNAVIRKNGGGSPKATDDEPAAWLGGLYAAA